ncbi:hypothetical protein [Tabrizicola sp.]|uniref:hypothetical protein n=1 Tax=Tabrizicola sp. TaxID=2005166 RepID=UPI002732FA0C|nr:hypothetical protein [Tabrizicola sp.]MDP3196802.1 hypothetical protein [Tabrizicola sp.]
MTPASNPASRDTHPVTGRWLDFGSLLAQTYRPMARPVRLHPKEARALRLAGRLHRLLTWLTRPMPATGRSATDAATRLEILTRGGFPR